MRRVIIKCPSEFQANDEPGRIIKTECAENIEIHFKRIESLSCTGWCIPKSPESFVTLHVPEGSTLTHDYYLGLFDMTIPPLKFKGCIISRIINDNKIAIKFLRMSENGNVSKMWRI